MFFFFERRGRYVCSSFCNHVRSRSSRVSKFDNFSSGNNSSRISKAAVGVVLILLFLDTADGLWTLFTGSSVIATDLYIIGLFPIIYPALIGWLIWIENNQKVRHSISYATLLNVGVAGVYFLGTLTSVSFIGLYSLGAFAKILVSVSIFLNNF